jgi:hypothetical protein
MERKLNGLERLIEDLRAEVLEDIVENLATPTETERCTELLAILDRCSIGQLYALSQFGPDWKHSELYLIEEDTGIISMKFRGLIGGMDLEGDIHT